MGKIEGKEEVLMIKMAIGSRIFLLGCAENVRVFGAFRDWGRMWGVGRGFFDDIGFFIRFYLVYADF